MSYGPVQVFETGIASGASTSSFIDLGKSQSKIAIKYVTMSTGMVVTVYGGTTSTGEFLPVHERVNTAPVQYQALQIATSVSGSWALVESLPFRFIKLVTTGVVSGGVSFVVTIAD